MIVRFFTADAGSRWGTCVGPPKNVTRGSMMPPPGEASPAPARHLTATLRARASISVLRARSMRCDRSTGTARDFFEVHAREANRVGGDLKKPLSFFGSGECGSRARGVFRCQEAASACAAPKNFHLLATLLPPSPPLRKLARTITGESMSTWSSPIYSSMISSLYIIRI
jgi:hypothetical protein